MLTWLDEEERKTSELGCGFQSSGGALWNVSFISWKEREKKREKGSLAGGFYYIHPVVYNYTETADNFFF